MRFSALMLFLAMGSAAQAQTVHFLTEEYPPFSYRQDDTLRGISVDQVRKIAENGKLDYTLEMQPWARAFSLTESTPSTCVFTTGMLAERVARFKWVLPLVVDHMTLVRKAGAPFTPATIEEAKHFTIGVHKDDSAEAYAKQQNFPRLDSAPSLELSLKKLLSDRVDMMFMTRTTYESLRQQGQPIEATLDLEGIPAGIACNLAVPDETITRMQTALDALIASGEQDAIFKQYGK